MLKHLQWIGLFFVLVHHVVCLDNGLALRPAMGFNTWNAFHEEIDEGLARESADLLISTGLAAAGYTYFNLDGASLPASGMHRPAPLND